ncbi:uncharacterized protein TrAtP1_000917 [Trichoderma atroviride]|uniref:uncharacterized protein n=1 Tax=Hypocrea atroviridis TaxID=63577 RepID=UPI0033234B41|nr:hypothetical protein TrAtP1_000917 [Trichoderma atroviride]
MNIVFFYVLFILSPMSHFISFFQFYSCQKGNLRNILLDPARASGFGAFFWSAARKSGGKKSHSERPPSSDRQRRWLLTGTLGKTDSFGLFSLVNTCHDDEPIIIAENEAVNDFLVHRVTMMMRLISLIWRGPSLDHCGE